MAVSSGLASFGALTYTVSVVLFAAPISTPGTIVVPEGVTVHPAAILIASSSTVRLMSSPVLLVPVFIISTVYIWSIPGVTLAIPLDGTLYWMFTPKSPASTQLETRRSTIPSPINTKVPKITRDKALCLNISLKNELSCISIPHLWLDPI